MAFRSFLTLRQKPFLIIIVLLMLLGLVQEFMNNLTKASGSLWVIYRPRIIVLLFVTALLATLCLIRILLAKGRRSTPHRLTRTPWFDE